MNQVDTKAWHGSSATINDLPSMLHVNNNNNNSNNSGSVSPTIPLHVMSFNGSSCSSSSSSSSGSGRKTNGGRRPNKESGVGIHVYFIIVIVCGIVQRYQCNLN